MIVLYPRLQSCIYCKGCYSVDFFVNPATLGTVQLDQNSEVAACQKYLQLKNDPTSHLMTNFAVQSQSLCLASIPGRTNYHQQVDHIHIHIQGSGKASEGGYTLYALYTFNQFYLPNHIQNVINLVWGSPGQVYAVNIC